MSHQVENTADFFYDTAETTLFGSFSKIYNSYLICLNLIFQ